ncbi:MAG: hypothetical protein M1G31_23145 [Pseudanabaena sp. Salubria-1]|nr:hypothetical protein [Pseudanabaena sp. Salubria-1]
MVRLVPRSQTFRLYKCWAIATYFDTIQALSALPDLNFSQPRALPEWADIFSNFVCLCVNGVH